MRDRLRNGSYQSWRPLFSIASIHAKSKELFETLSSRSATSRSSALVKNFGWPFCMNGSNQLLQRLRSSAALSLRRAFLPIIGLSPQEVTNDNSTAIYLTSTIAFYRSVFGPLMEFGRLGPAFLGSVCLDPFSSFLTTSFLSVRAETSDAKSFAHVCCRTNLPAVRVIPRLTFGGQTKAASPFASVHLPTC